MNKKISLVVLLGVVFCVAAIAITMEVSDGNLKLKKRDHDVYYPNNSVCKTKCAGVGGESCGYMNLNCCYKGSCSWGSCSNRLPIEGCTTKDG